jgi:integrase/recombinase XerD
VQHLELRVEAFRAYVENRHSKATATKYAQAVNKFLAFCGRHGLSFESLPPGVLSIFADYMLAEGSKLSTVRATVSGVSKYLNWCRTKGKVMPLLSEPDLPRGSRPAPKILVGKALLAYLAVASRLHEPIRTALLLAPYCGLRSDELVNLQLSDIRKFTTQGGDMLAFSVIGKGQKHRVAPVLLDGKPLLVAYLRGWRARQRGPFLFPMADGSPLSSRTLRHHVLHIARRIGESKLSPHTLRRTYLTTLHRHGLDTATIAKIAGHASVQTTMDHYLAIEPEMMAGAVSGVRLVERGPHAEKVSDAKTRLSGFLGSTSNGRAFDVPEPPLLMPEPEEDE